MLLKVTLGGAHKHKEYVCFTSLAGEVVLARLINLSAENGAHEAAVILGPSRIFSDDQNHDMSGQHCAMTHWVFWVYLIRMPVISKKPTKFHKPDVQQEIIFQRHAF